MPCLLEVSLYITDRCYFATAPWLVCVHRIFGRSSCPNSEEVSAELFLLEACFDKVCRQLSVKRLSCHISSLAGDEQRTWTRSPCRQVRQDTCNRAYSTISFSQPQGDPLSKGVHFELLYHPRVVSAIYCNILILQVHLRIILLLTRGGSSKIRKPQYSRLPTSLNYHSPEDSVAVAALACTLFGL